MKEILESLNLTCKFVSDELSHDDCRLIEDDDEDEDDDDDIYDSWLLLPMTTKNTKTNNNDLTSSDLGAKLSDPEPPRR